MSSQFGYEAYLMVNNANRDELLDIIRASFLQAGSRTIQSKRISIKRTGKMLKHVGYASKHYIGQKVHAARSGDLKQSFRQDIEDLKQRFEGIPSNIWHGIQTFYYLPAEKKKEQLAWGICGMLGYLGSAGGLDAEGGLPDMDTAIFGIGAHRNIFFHSIIIGFGVEFAIRFVFALIRRLQPHLPDTHLKLWDDISGLSLKMEEGLVQGTWLGLSIHLLQDANIFGDATKPYTWMPGSHSMDFHQGAFGVNGTAAGVFSAGHTDKRSEK